MSRALDNEEQEVLDTITQHYFDSGDFNGLPIRELDLLQELKIPILSTLIRTGNANINFGDAHPNPHILAFEPCSSIEQIEKLSSCDLSDACAYPSPEHLKSIVNDQLYHDRPYKRDLALGGPQLKYHFLT